MYVLFEKKKRSTSEVFILYSQTVGYRIMFATTNKKMSVPNYELMYRTVEFYRAGETHVVMSPAFQPIVVVINIVIINIVVVVSSQCFFTRSLLISLLNNSCLVDTSDKYLSLLRNRMHSIYAAIIIIIVYRLKSYYDIFLTNI